MTDNYTISLIEKIRRCAGKPLNNFQIVVTLANIEEIFRKHQAEKEVLRVRGSYDAPGFDACVAAEVEHMKSKHEKIRSRTREDENPVADTLIDCSGALEKAKRDYSDSHAWFGNGPGSKGDIHIAKHFWNAAWNHQQREISLPFDKECFHLAWEDNLNYDEVWYQDNHDRLEKFVSYYESCKAMKSAKSPMREAGCHKCDAEMERVKACEHIAEGDMEGNDWRILRNICPSTAAVAALRDKYEAAIAYDPNIDGCPTYTEEEQEGMLQAFKDAEQHHGMYETLFAVTTYLLRKRGHLPPINSIEGGKS